MTTLQGKQVCFSTFTPPLPAKRYAISGVPLDFPENSLLGVHGTTHVPRVVKANTKTTCVIITTTEEVPTKIRIAFGRPLNVRAYVPEPSQCYQCYRWGHVANLCKRKS